MGVKPVSPTTEDLPAATGSSDSHESTYRVKNIFQTLQGEGFFAGRPAVFVRLVGCNMWSGYEDDRERDAERTGADCPRWCDTDFTREGAETYSAEGLARAMIDESGDIRFCVLTGGEPLLQADVRLMQVLGEAGFQIAVETNGTVALKDRFVDETTGRRREPDWIVCSPKLPEEELTLEYFDELKLIVPDYRPEQYSSFSQRARIHRLGGNRVPLLWLQPEDGPRLREAQELALEIAADNPDWRVSVQTHKVLGIQ